MESLKQLNQVQQILFYVAVYLMVGMVVSLFYISFNQKKGNGIKGVKDSYLTLIFIVVSFIYPIVLLIEFWYLIKRKK